MYNQKKGAFTLVELIVVITILTILSTIAFISIQGYIIYARDAGRISDINNISRALEVSITKTGRVPTPDNYSSILSNSLPISYQGYAGKNSLSQLGVYNGGQDSLDKQYYTYSTNHIFSKYQVIAFLEQSGLGLKTSESVYSNTTKRVPKTIGNQIGIVLHQDNVPIQENTETLDIALTNDRYNIHISDNNILSGTGQILRDMFPKISCKRIFEVNSQSESGVYTIYPNADDRGIDVYCDMTTDGGGWTLVAYFPHESMSFTGAVIGSPSTFIDEAGWKLSDSDINTIPNTYFRFKGIGNTPCDEYLYCQDWNFNYSIVGGADNMTQCSRTINGSYTQNGNYPGNFYTISHWNARDVWLDWYGITRWEIDTPLKNNCGFQEWHNPSLQRIARDADIQMFIK